MRAIGRLIFGVSITFVSTSTAFAECADKLKTSDNIPRDILSCLKELETQNAELRAQLVSAEGLAERVETLEASGKSGPALPIGAVVGFSSVDSCEKLGPIWEDAGIGGRFLVAARPNSMFYHAARIDGVTSIRISPDNIPPFAIDAKSIKWGDINDTGDVTTGISILRIAFQETMGADEVHTYVTKRTEARAIDVIPPPQPLLFAGWPSSGNTK